ncbi:MAG TPA: hypothetical protein ENG74_03005 [Thermoplasmatales archaeon]|nr:hypothetical protein [Thermoplasmatales archaeon]
MKKGFIVLCLIAIIFLASTIASVTASNTSRKHKKISPVFKTRALEGIKKRIRIETNYLMKNRLTMLSSLRFWLPMILPPAHGCRSITCFSTCQPIPSACMKTCGPKC